MVIVFGEKTMQMAKSLAQDLVRVQEKQSAQDTFNDIKNKVLEIWETIKSSVADAFETIYGQGDEYIISKNEPSKNWHAPMKIEAPPMPDIPMARMMNIRSDL